GSERVRDRGADRAACLVGRPEHEVVDEQLGAAVEELGEGLRAVLRLEAVVLVDPDPGQLAPLPGQLVAPAGELLLLLQQLVALRLPLLLGADPVLRQRATSCLGRPRLPRLDDAARRASLIAGAVMCLCSGA